MGVFEAVVVFVIAWWLVFLPSLSAGNRSQADAGEVVDGSEPGAPHSWKLSSKAILATVGAAILTLIVWVVLTFQLVSIPV